MLERDLSRLDVYHRLGVRIIQLTYNDRNLVGDGCLEPGDAGVSAFGRAGGRAHERARASRSTSATAGRRRRPTASRTRRSRRSSRTAAAARSTAIRAARRTANCKAMADKGGVVGIYFMPFIGPGPGAPTVDDADAPDRSRHQGLRRGPRGHRQRPQHGADRGDAGVPRRSTSAFVEGRESRGISAPDEERPLFIPELNHSRRHRGRGPRPAASGSIPDATIEKIIGGNFHRVFKEIWTS